MAPTESDDIIEEFRPRPVQTYSDTRQNAVQMLLKDADVNAILLSTFSFSSVPTENDYDSFLLMLERTTAHAPLFERIREQHGRVPTGRDLKKHFHSLALGSGSTILFLMCDVGCCLVVDPASPLEPRPHYKKHGMYAAPTGWKCEHCGSFQVKAWEYSSVAAFIRKMEDPSVTAEHYNTAREALHTFEQSDDKLQQHLADAASKNPESDRSSFFASDAFLRFFKDMPFAAKGTTTVGDQAIEFNGADATQVCPASGMDLYWGFNTDGAALTKLISAWPIILRLFNLPPEVRSNVDLLHMCGIAGGSSSAKDIASFLVPLILDMAIASRFGTYTLRSENDTIAVIRKRSFCLLSMQDLGANPKTWFAAGTKGIQSCPLCNFEGIPVVTANGGNARCLGERSLRRSGIWSGSLALSDLLSEQPLAKLSFRSQSALLTLLNDLVGFLADLKTGLAQSDAQANINKKKYFRAAALRSFRDKKRDIFTRFGLTSTVDSHRATVSPLWIMPFASFPDYFVTLDVMHIFGNLYGHLYQHLLAENGVLHLYTPRERDWLENQLKHCFVTHGAAPPHGIFAHGGSLKMHDEKNVIMRWAPLLLLRSLASDFPYFSRGNSTRDRAFFVDNGDDLVDDKEEESDGLDNNDHEQAASSDTDCDGEASGRSSDSSNSSSDIIEQEFENIRRKLRDADNDDEFSENDDTKDSDHEQSESESIAMRKVDAVELTYALWVVAYSISYMYGSFHGYTITLGKLEIIDRCLFAAYVSISRFIQQQGKHVPPTFHHLLHLVECVRRFGNLLATSLWSFERKLKFVREALTNPRYAVSSTAKSMKIREYISSRLQQSANTSNSQSNPHTRGPQQTTRVDWKSCFVVGSFFFDREFDFFDSFPASEVCNHTLISLFKAIGYVKSHETVIKNNILRHSKVRCFKMLYVRNVDEHGENQGSSADPDSVVFNSVAYYAATSTGIKVPHNSKKAKQNGTGVRRGCYATVQWLDNVNGQECVSESLVTVLFFVTVTMNGVSGENENGEKEYDTRNYCYARVRWFDDLAARPDLQDKVFAPTLSRQLFECGKYRELGCGLFTEIGDDAVQGPISRMNFPVAFGVGKTVLDFTPGNLRGRGGSNVQNQKESLAWIECSSISEPACTFPFTAPDENSNDSVHAYWTQGKFRTW